MHMPSSHHPRVLGHSTSHANCQLRLALGGRHRQRHANRCGLKLPSTALNQGGDLAFGGVSECAYYAVPCSHAIALNAECVASEALTSGLVFVGRLGSPCGVSGVFGVFTDTNATFTRAHQGSAAQGRCHVRTRLFEHQICRIR